MSVPSINILLKEIESGELETVIIRITEVATKWAVAGFMEQANQLLENMWSYGFEHPRDLWLTDQGFQIMLQMNGNQPASVPFYLNTIDEIERENWSTIIYPMWSGGSLPFDNNTAIEISADKILFSNAITSAANGSRPVTEIMADLERYLESGDAIGYTYFQATTAASLLAAKDGLEIETEKFIKLWGEGYLKYSENYQLSSLMRHRATASFLSKGILAPTFMFTKEAIQKDMEQIIVALSIRVKEGRKLPYGHLAWSELLKRISVLAIEQDPSFFTNDITSAKWLGKMGASDADLQKAEQRLGVSLPDDYKAFLRLSNGFGSITPIGVTVMPVNSIDYFISLDKSFVETWAEDVMADDVSLNKMFRQSIVIGGENEEQKVLLVPDNKGGWECWFFSTWSLGETKYPSFRFYVETQLIDLEENSIVDG